jgi:thiamine-monophosphate kinase
MELDFIRWLQSQTPAHRAVAVGIGDDAAVLVPPGTGQIVVTTDMLMDGVDFELSPSNAQRVGRKSLAVNLSDLAAMAARPLAAFISVALPRQNGRTLGEALYRGQLELAKEFNMALAGGDTNSWEGALVISVTAIGEVTERGPLLRSGAKPGDQILVTGSFGGSILGRHFDFTPRVSEALTLHEKYSLHACIDVSDGLSLDLARMAHASGCGAVLDLSRIPIAADAARLTESLADGTTPLDHALADGEDFELIVAASPEDSTRIVASQPVGVPISCVGYFVDQPGLWQLLPDGSKQILTPRGYQHELQ